MNAKTKSALTTMATIVLCVAAFALFVRLDQSGALAQEAPNAKASPSPTPVDQRWKVEYGEIETLELKCMN